MEPTYEILLLSDLFKKSRQKPHPDFCAAVAYIFRRLAALREAHPGSRFHRTFGRIAGFLPINICIRFLYHLRYDAMIGFCRQENHREIYGMISFQKHPSLGKIGMFDIYVSPERRAKDLLGNFPAMAELVYRLCERFLKKGYYIQCGANETTRRVLRLYQRLAERNKWEISVDVNATRIYLARSRAF